MNSKQCLCHAVHTAQNELSHTLFISWPCVIVWPLDGHGIWMFYNTQGWYFERIRAQPDRGLVPLLCTAHDMMHCMLRFCSLSWLWQPVGARQGAFSALCSIFSQWYHLLFMLSPFQSASGVCQMTCCLGKYVCTRTPKAQSVCVWRAVRGVCCKPLEHVLV